MQKDFLLVADIGGTHSRFALFMLEKEPEGLSLSLVPDSKLSLKTGAYKNFQELLASLTMRKTSGGFTLLGDYKPVAACLAIPAPVTDKNQDIGFHAPNIAWPLRVADFSSVGKLPCILINDFAAQGLAGLFPEVLGLVPVLTGSARADAPAVMLGAGTGLGKAIILPCVLPSCGRRRALRDSPLPDLAQSNGYGSFAGKLFIPDGFVDCSRVLPSEGGHSLFPFKGQEEAAFQEFLLRMTKRKEAIGDMVVTGSGLSALYAYHNDDNFLRPSPEIAAKINGAIPNLPAPGMASPGSGSDPLVKSLEWLARFYGRVARNFVLEVLALGGVYLSGGMLEHVPALLGHSAFAAEFRGSESQHELLQEVPVNWVSNQEVGLWGAALYSLQLLSQDNLPQA